MKRRDFRIAEPSRQKIKLTGAVFPTDESLDMLYRDAADLAFRYNSRIREEGRSEGFISPGKLHASAVLHLIYQIVLTARMEDGHMDFFTRRISPVVSNEELFSVLHFF